MRIISTKRSAPLNERVEVTKIRADQINKKIFDNYSDKTVQQEEFFDEQAGAKQSAYDKRLAEQRSNLEKQKYGDINNLQNQLAKEKASPIKRS